MNVVGYLRQHEKMMTIDEQKNSGVGAGLTAFALIVAAAFFCWAQLKILTPNHDVTWLIAMSQQIMQGGKYYTDFYELNPPLYMILIIPLDYFSRITGIPTYHSLIISVSILVCGVSIACHRYFSPILQMNRVGDVAIALCFEAALFFLPEADFGQRDPVALLLMLPTIFWLATRAPADRLTVAPAMAVALAGIGFLIKPYLFCIGLAVYALRFALRRDFRIFIDPAIAIIGVLAALYVAVIWLMFPEWITMAHIAGTFYSAYDTNVWVTDTAKIGLAIILALVVLNEFLQESLTAKNLCRYLAASAFGAVMSYIIQHKGFNYHFVPAEILISVLFARTVLGGFRLVRRFWGGDFLYEQRGVVTGLAITLILLRIVDWAAFEAGRRDLFLRQFMASMADFHVGKKVYFFSTSMYPQYPLNIYDGTAHTSRFPCLWTLPAILKLDQENGAAEGVVSAQDKDLISLVHSDFDRWTPDVVIVDESPKHQALPGRFDFLAWFRRDPEMAQVLDQYQLVGRFHGSKLAVFETDFAIYAKPAATPLKSQ